MFTRLHVDQYSGNECMPNLNTAAVESWMKEMPGPLVGSIRQISSAENWVIDRDRSMVPFISRLGSAMDLVDGDASSLVPNQEIMTDLRIVLAYISMPRRIIVLKWISTQDRGEELLRWLIDPEDANDFPDGNEYAAIATIRHSLAVLCRKQLLTEIFDPKALEEIVGALKEAS